MAKLLRIRDYILLAAASAGETLEEVRLLGGLMPEVMKLRYGYVPPNYKKNSYFSTASRLLSTGEIRKGTDKNGEVYLELTSKGAEKFKRRFPLAHLSAQKWDGNFMIVIFDIPEKEKPIRESLRNKLMELGFGMLQESVWATPFHFENDLREFLVSHGLEDKAYVLSAKGLFAGDIRKLAEKIWKIEDLRRSYQEVIQKLNSMKSFKNTDAKSLGEIWELYLSVIKSDPFLPDKLLEGSTLRKEAGEALNKLKI